MLGKGDKAPPFRGRDQHGQDVSLEDRTARGPVVLYFYPKDFTGVCTKEACLFRDSYEDLAELGASIVGVSVDDDETHARFAERHHIGFSLISDRNREISRAYGVLRAFGVFTKRVTFVIDTTGVIRGVFHYELNAHKHLDGVRNLLRELEPEAKLAASPT